MKTKHVENVFITCLDVGSIPTGSTTKLINPYICVLEILSKSEILKRNLNFILE